MFPMETKIRLGKSLVTTGRHMAQSLISHHSDSLANPGWHNSKKACLRCKTAGHSTSNCPGSAPKVGETANPRQKIAQVERAEKGKEKGADLHSDFSMEVEIPGSAEISSATNKTAAGILTLPDVPQHQP